MLSAFSVAVPSGRAFAPVTEKRLPAGKRRQGGCFGSKDTRTQSNFDNKGQFAEDVKFRGREPSFRSYQDSTGISGITHL